jgi:hypothetical protein
MRASLLLPTLLLGCGAQKTWETDGGLRRSDARDGGVLVAQVVGMWELPAPDVAPAQGPSPVEQSLDEAHLPTPTVLDPVADGGFLRNEYAGNVRMGGGMVLTGAVVLEARARLVEFGLQAELQEQGRRWLHDAVDQALDDRGLPHTSVVVAPTTPARVPSRGMHDDDGTDNLNLPRLELQAPVMPTLEGDHSERWLLVPYLRSYYTHNAGWFLGQRNGCMGGARVDTYLVLFDRQSGAVVWTMEAMGRHIEPHKGQPGRAELDQYLLWAEGKVEAALKDGLFR